jgi:hypothetical protein
MLTITNEQMVALREPGIETFVKKMIVHLNKYFPHETKKMDEVKIREFVNYGIQRAGSYKISIERDVAGYLDLMIVLGRDFDTDQEYSWAGKVLTSTKLPDRRVSVLRKMASTDLKNRAKQHDKGSTTRA